MLVISFSDVTFGVGRSLETNWKWCQNREEGPTERRSVDGIVQLSVQAFSEPNLPIQTGKNDREKS